MDLETRNVNGEFLPYCICIFDGNVKSTFYLSDYSNPTELLENSVLYLMKRKYNGYKVMLHNFSKFDGVFLLKILSKLSDDLVPTINNNNYINFTFKFAKYYLHFRDSYLLLPLSLEKLAKGFDVERKGIFPILFVNNKDVDLNYIGSVLPFESFVGITKDEFLEYKKRFNDKDWNLRMEVTKYCSQDVISLYQVINKFNNIVFDEFRIDVLKYPTLPSLAFAIFRCKFLGNYKIPKIIGNMYNEIKLAYTGGNVDVYKPYGENIYHYDINSLYPYVMKNFQMPVGEPIYFEGDILKYKEKAFGFFFFDADIKAPINLNIPLLQTRLKINNTTKTITPVGEWKDFYFSEELYKSEEFNYKFKINSGYLFEKEFIFKEYVDYFYNMKVLSDKNSPHYIIAKLFLNSLYGRLGMDPIKEKHLIVNSSESFHYYDKFCVTNVINLDNKELISYLDLNSQYEDFYIGSNVSVPISAAVTAYARIYMHKFKKMNNIIIYYTDTDSIAINKELDKSLVGKDLGQFKLEYISNKAIFLAPKVYYCLTNEGKFCKIKGLNLANSDIISFNDFFDLLFKDNKFTINQEKWYKNFSKGTILVKENIYTLSKTSGKRESIFDKDNKFIDTKPLILKNGQLESK
jgi:hypothetical protein